MEVFFGFLILLSPLWLLIGLMAFLLWASSRAKRQHETVVTLSPARVQRIVESTFNKTLWADVEGPGVINKRRRTINDTGSTVSIDIGQTPDGNTHVLAWMSAWVTRYGVVLGTNAGSLSRKVIQNLEKAQG